jgi:hypothetical protein
LIKIKYPFTGISFFITGKTMISMIKRFFLFFLFLCSIYSYNQAQNPDWLQTARVFLLDAYQPPFAPELEYDAEAVAETMVDMHANILRLGTMGKYATIQGVRFSTHPDQGGRDLLAESIAACKWWHLFLRAISLPGRCWQMIIRNMHISQARGVVRKNFR